MDGSISRFCRVGASTRVGSDVFHFYLEGAQMVRIEFLTVAAKSIGGRGSNP